MLGGAGARIKKAFAEVKKMSSGDPKHSRRRVIWIEGNLAVALVVIGVLWLDGHRINGIPDELGPIPIGVPYFGALGGLMRSLDGALRFHRNVSGDVSSGVKWDTSYEAWHHFRIFMGALAGTIAVLIFISGILGAGLDLETGATANRPQNLVFFLFAFIVGYRERVFFQLLQRLADVVLTTASEAPTLSADPRPAEGKERDTVHLLGTGLGAVASVYFGDKPATIKAKSDTLIIVEAPEAPSGTNTVPVSLSGSGGTVSTAFKYK